MTRSRLLAAGGGVAAAAALAACGGRSAPAEQPAAAKRPVTLIVDNDWTQGDRLKVVQAWLEHANKVYPHIKTDLREMAETQEKTIALFAADQQGDLFQLDQHMVPVFGPKGLLFDISSTLAALKFDATKLYDVKNITHWDNKRHGIIVQLNVNSGVYNKSAFQQAGVKEPTADWTWDDLEAAGKRLLQRFPEGSNTFMIQPFAEDIRHFPYFAWSVGGAMIEGSGIIPPDKTIVKVYSPQNIRQWQRYVDWITKLHIIARPDERSDWANERQATDLRTRDSVPGYLRLDWMKDHAAMALPPKGTAPRRTRSTTRASAIPPNVRNRDASWEVVKFMTGKEGLEITMAGGYTQPVRKSVEPAFQRTLGPFESFQVYMDSQKAYGDGVPYHAQWIELEPVVRQHVQRAVKGETTVDQALKDLHTAMELAFKTAAETFNR
jgi:multiple sugar transport system substrate-binding protein